MVPGNVLKASELKRSVESSDDKSWVRMEEDLAAALLLALLLMGGWKREQDVRNGAGRAIWWQSLACCQQHRGFCPGIFNSTLTRSHGVETGLVHSGRSRWVLRVGIRAGAARTYPKLGEVGVRGVVGFVMSLQEDVDDFLLLLREFGLQALLEGFLLLALQYHLALPLNLLVRQDDCRDRERVRNRHPHHLANRSLNLHQPHPAPALDCRVTASRNETETVYSPFGRF